MHDMSDTYASPDKTLVVKDGITTGTIVLTHLAKCIKKTYIYHQGEIKLMYKKFVLPWTEMSLSLV